MKTQYTVLVYVTVDHDPDEQPYYSGPEIERITIDAVGRAYKRLRVDVDGELLETEVQP